MRLSERITMWKIGKVRPTLLSSSVWGGRVVCCLIRTRHACQVDGRGPGGEIGKRHVVPV
jgi:hypothetical protein